MSAAEDWEYTRAARKKPISKPVGYPTERGLKNPVIITHCIECGAVIPYDERCNLHCPECWEKRNRR